MIVLLDTNVVLDWLRGRQPFADAATRVVDAVVAGRLTGVIAAITISNAYYIAKVPPGRVPAEAFVADLRRFGRIVPFDDALLTRALEIDLPDLEDALQAASAEAAGARYLVTRDQDGFPRSPVPAIDPLALLELLAAPEAFRGPEE